MTELKRGIIVSIQGYSLVTTAELAGEAIRAGAVAIRTDKPLRLGANAERVPVIGLHKTHVREPSKEPYLTSTLAEVQDVARWADLVAADFRNCNAAEREKIAVWCRANQKPLVADLETLDDWRAVQGLPYDFVTTTFSVFHMNHRPDLRLVEALRGAGERRLIAEGNFSARADVQAALRLGAHGVCLGAAVANVYKLTRKYTTLEF